MTRRSANKYFLVPLLAILALTPLFFGSARPFFWAFWAAVSLIFIAAHLVFVNSGKVPFFPISTSLKVVFALFLTIVFAVFLQVLPIGGLVGPFEFNTNGETIVESEYLSLTPGDSMLGLLRWTTYGAVFYLALQLAFRNEARSRVLLRATIYIIGIYAFYALVALSQLDDTILFMEKWAYHGFATGTFVNRNSFATFLGLGVVICICFLMEPVTKQKFARNNFMRYVIILSILILITFTLVQTGSRLGLFSTGLAVSYLVLMNIKLRWSLPLILLSLVFIFVTILLSGDDTSLFDRLLGVGSNLGERIALYQEIIPMIFSKPIFGYGMGSFENAFPLMRGDLVSPFKVWNLAHSTYLANWFDLGLFFGSLPLLIFFIVGIKISTNGVFQKGSIEKNAALGCLLLVGVHSIFDFSLEIHANAIFITFIMALGFASSIRANANQQQ